VSLDVDVSTSGVRSPVAAARLADAARAALRAERVRNALVSVALIDRRAIARMNQTHLGHRGPTDVISFSFARASARDPVIGDVYIAPDVARDNAAARGVSVREEMLRLVVHGTLHVLGHDHPEGPTRERSPMWRKQERIVRRLTAQAAERSR
jgi:probable rRNA maturation factor